MGSACSSRGKGGGGAVEEMGQLQEADESAAPTSGKEVEVEVDEVLDELVDIQEVQNALAVPLEQGEEEAANELDDELDGLDDLDDLDDELEAGLGVPRFASNATERPSPFGLVAPNAPCLSISNAVQQPQQQFQQAPSLFGALIHQQEAPSSSAFGGQQQFQQAPPFGALSFGTQHQQQQQQQQQASSPFTFGAPPQIPGPMSHGSGPAPPPLPVPTLSHGSGAPSFLPSAMDAHPMDVELDEKQMLPVTRLRTKFGKALSVRAKENGVIRIFLSSPFRGMEEERKQLVERYIPGLRDQCEEAGVLLSVLDMRWGITDSQAEAHKIILICLDSIADSDIFIGFYGSRYGTYGLEDEWVQKNFDVAAPLHPWIKEYRDRSITELEFRAACSGVAAEPYKPSLVYFRDPEFDAARAKELAAAAEASPDPELQKAYRDQISAYRQESADSADKLLQLSASIAESASAAGIGGVVSTNYESPRLGAGLIASCLTNVFEDFLPTGGLSDYDKTKASILAHARARKSGYIDIGLLAELTQEVDDALKSATKQAILIRGESGSGKTSLLAAWFMAHREDKDRAVSFFSVGVNATGSVDLLTLLEYVNVSLGEAMGQEPDAMAFGAATTVPKGLHAQQLVKDIQEKCTQLAAADRKVCIVLDALNQLAPDPNVVGMPEQEKLNPFTLWWLPEKVLQSVCFVISSLDGPVTSILEKWEKQRDYTRIYKLPALTEGHRREIVNTIFAANGKTMAEPLLELLTKSEVGTSPLALSIIAAEMLSFGEHFQLQQKVQELCNSRTIPVLLKSVLKRLEDLFESDLPGVVKDTLRIVYAAKSGVSEVEMMATLNHPLIRAAQPRAYVQMANWLPVYHAMRHLIVSRGGLYTFAHSHVRSAVFSEYVVTIQLRKDAIRAFLEVVSAQSSAKRQIQEQCLRRSVKHGVMTGIANLASDDSFLSSFCTADKALNLQWAESDFKKLGDPGAILLSLGLARQTFLTTLRLEGNEIGDVGLGLLARRCNLLRSLNVEDNSITDDGVLALCPELRRPDCTLRDLDLSNNFIALDGLQHLAQALRDNASLRLLNLDLNEPLEDAQARKAATQAFAKALHGNTTLETLVLHDREVYEGLRREALPGRSAGGASAPLLLRVGVCGRSTSAYFRSLYRKRLEASGHSKSAAALPLARLTCVPPTPGVPCGEVLVGNTHSEPVSGSHVYKLYCRPSSDAPEVSHIRWDLHPTFSRFVQWTRKQPFELDLRGWGSFGVGITIYWSNPDAAPLRLCYELDFSHGGAEVKYQLLSFGDHRIGAHPIERRNYTLLARHKADRPAHHEYLDTRFPHPDGDAQDDSGSDKSSGADSDSDSGSDFGDRVMKSAPRKKAPRKKAAPRKRAPRKKKAAATKAPPMKSAPMKSAPMKPAPMKSAPMKSAPMKAAPMKSAPMKAVPMKSAPMKAVPMKSAPMKSAPRKKAAPTKAAPMIARKGAPTKSAPIKQPAALSLPDGSPMLDLDLLSQQAVLRFPLPPNAALLW